MKDSIAHYRLGSKLGEGGMGEVYQATDTKLHREVALKFLPEALTEDPETLDRFRREARALATLSHPNIGAIHGIEESEGRVALVLELVAGDTLADRIAEGSLDRSEVLTIAAQVAAALESAHDQGIVHRDLKPANIKITPEGQVKVLDFGLAKSIQTEMTRTGGVAESPTIMMTAAQPGMVMGTAPYMSPEQAKGAPVDRRADIWAYGAVLFEMLTGSRLFEGDDVAEVLAAVISTEPDLSRLPAAVPMWLRDLITRCLRRDVMLRLPHIGAARIALLEGEETDPDEPPDAAHRNLLAAVVMLTTGLVLGALGTWLVRPAAVQGIAEARYAEVVFDPPPRAGTLPVISPDGRLIAYPGGGDETRRNEIFVRDLADGTTRSLPGTDWAEGLAFSPDSRSLAFMTAGILHVSVLGGGRPEPIAAVVGSPIRTVWLANDTVVVSTGATRQLHLVDLAGGTVEFIELDEPDAETMWFTDPVALPNENMILASRWRSGGGDGADIVAISLDTRKLTMVVRGSSPRLVGSSTLVFLQRGELVAATFDPDTLSVSGSVQSIAPAGTQNLAYPRETMDQIRGAIHDNGLALLPMGGGELPELVWVSRTGEESSTGYVVDAVSSTAGGGGLALSPDDSRVVFATSQPFIVELNDLAQRRMLPKPGPSISYPRWDPQGEYVTVIGNETGSFLGYRIAATGARAPEQFTDEPSSIPTSFFPDGNTMLGYVVTNDMGRDLWVFRIDGEDEVLLRTAANERAPVVAPDGGAFAYVSDESGEDRVYIRLYPDNARQWGISGDGASAPLWSRDGSELFFIQNDRMMAVSVDRSDGLRHGEPTELFAAGPYVFDSFGNNMYDVASDGRFLMMRRGIGPRTWRWIQNWGADLDRALTATR